MKLAKAMGGDLEDLEALAQFTAIVTGKPIAAVLAGLRGQDRRSGA
jgi:hypothetical protein